MKQKGFVLLPLILIFLVIGLVGYFVYKNVHLKEQLPKSQITPIITAIPIPTQEKITKTFQEILYENCKKIDFNGGYFYGIAPLLLPVSIDPSLTLNYRDQNTFACTSDQETTRNQYVLIETKEKTLINLYDENSKEGGHGGPAFLGSLPTTIGEKDNILFSLTLDWPHGGCALLDSLNVVVRGLRSLKLSNGETIYINTNMTAIEANDPGLKNILSKNTHPCEFELDKLEVEYEGTEKNVMKAFFADLNNLGNNEKQVIEKITHTLNSISPK